MAADDAGLTGLWFDGAKYFGSGLPARIVSQETPVLCETKRWLDLYFCGTQPDFTPPLHLPASSAFRREVWALLLQIPYGQTTTYGQLAQQLARQLGLKQMSPQAVGNAVGHNPISIIVPCLRVVGAYGSLTGYAGGMEKKVRLLTLEQADLRRCFLPKRSTAP